jgi:hypothetical protein
LGNEFSVVVKWTPYNSTTQTIVLQIKATRYPSDWVVGGSGGNLLTANQSSAETDTTGVSGTGGTLSRTTTAGEYYAGTAGFKVAADGSQTYAILAINYSPITAGKYYCFSAYAKASVAKNLYAYIIWKDANGTILSTSYSATISAPTSSFVRIFTIAQAPTNATNCVLVVRLDNVVSGNILYVDNLMFEKVNDTNLTIWDDGAKNKLYIDIPNNLLKWTDYTSTIQCTFPTAQFLTETSTNTQKIITIVAIHNGATKELHCKYDGGTWYDGSGTLNNLVWTNTLTLGRFDGVLFNLVQYDYVLSSSQYSVINFSTNPLRWNNLYIANKTPGKITYKDGILTDENGNDITGLVSGKPIELPPSTATTIQMSDGLSGKWDVFTNDTFYP